MVPLISLSIMLVTPHLNFHSNAIAMVDGYAEEMVYNNYEMLPHHHQKEMVSITTMKMLAHHHHQKEMVSITTMKMLPTTTTRRKWSL